MIIDADSSIEDKIKVTWDWDSRGSDIPDDFEKYFHSIDECKVSTDGKWILLTSSSSGAAIIERSTCKCLFHAFVPNAHSIELLPLNRVVVALSHSPSGKGDCIQLYDMEIPDKVIFKDSLSWGHGVVWMENHKKLFALGDDVLVDYSLADWNTDKPYLKENAKWKLPTLGGHDLNRISDNELGITTNEDVYVFDIENKTFDYFKPLKGKKQVKSFSIDEKSSTMVYTQAEIDWWTHNIYMKNPDKVFSIDSINIYKARFVKYD